MRLTPIESKNKILLKNTVMLYILQFSTFFFSFITVPYQTRILGPAIYGVLNFAVAIMAYFQLFMDFGFLLSATEDISLHRSDKTYISKRLTSIACIKTGFALISFTVILALTFAVPKFAAHRAMYCIYALAYIANSFLPDYFFRGIEHMTAVTVRTVAVKLFSAVLTFVFLRTKSDYLVVPCLLLIGNLGAVIWAYFYIYKTLKYSFEKVTRKEILADLKHSALFFFSRIATTVYSATNTVIIGFIDKSGVATGYYTSADKVVNMARSGITPISDSVYPYMIKNRNFRIIKKIILILEPIIIAGCVFVWIFAKPLCVLAFGKEFAGTAPVLRGFLPLIVAILPNYLLGFPTLGAMKISKFANYSIFFGTAIHISGLVFLLASGYLNIVSLAWMTSISEISITLFRLFVVLKNKRLLSEETQ